MLWELYLSAEVQGLQHLQEIQSITLWEAHLEVINGVAACEETVTSQAHQIA